MCSKSPIIIVDNDPDDRQLIAEALESLQIPPPVRIFPNGQEAYISSGKQESTLF